MIVGELFMWSLNLILGNDLVFYILFFHFILYVIKY